MLNIKKIVISSLLLVIGFSATSIAYTDKVAIEKNYSEKVQNALDAIYGKDVFFVIADITLTAPKYKVQYTEESKAKRNKQKSSSNKMQLMPGYPVIRNLAPADMKTLPFDSVTNYIPPKIKKVVVDLYVNKSYSKSRSRKAVKLVTKLLSLNTKRGDKVNLKQEKFYRKPIPKQTIEITGSEQQLLTYQNLYYLITLVLFLVFLAIYIVMQLKSIKAQGKKGGKSSGGGGNTNVNVNPNVELKGSGGGGPSGDLKLSTAPPIKQYFDFIHEGNIHKLLYILKKENLPITQIAMLVSFLAPKPAAYLLTELDSKTQAAIAVNILQQKMADRVAIEKFETQIQAWLECLSGGPESFRETFENISSDNKKNILKILRGTDPQGFQKVRKNVLIFDDLRFLDDEEIKTLLSETSVEVLAIALASVDQETYSKIDKNLMKSAKDMIEQFLELKGKSLTKKDIELSQAKVLAIASSLEAEGKITLRSKIKS